MPVKQKQRNAEPKPPETVDGVIIEHCWLADRVVLKIDLSPTVNTLAVMTATEFADKFQESLLDGDKLDLYDIGIDGHWVQFERIDENTLSLVRVYPKPRGAQSALERARVGEPADA